MGLTFPEICLTGEEKTPKKPHPGNLSRPGSEPGPAVWQARMLPRIPQRWTPLLISIHILIHSLIIILHLIQGWGKLFISRTTGVKSYLLGAVWWRSGTHYVSSCWLWVLAFIVRAESFGNGWSPFFGPEPSLVLEKFVLGYCWWRRYRDERTC